MEEDGEAETEEEESGGGKAAAGEEERALGGWGGRGRGLVVFGEGKSKRFHDFGV